jgi:hypothetical protein
VQTLLEIKEFFNDLSLYKFEELATMDYEDTISLKLKSLEEIFERDIEKLKALSIGNKTRTALLCSMDNDVKFILKGIVDESIKNTNRIYQPLDIQINTV